MVREGLWRRGPAAAAGLVLAAALAGGAGPAAAAATGGTWGTAEEVPGTAALNQTGIAGVSSVSCAVAGSCSAVGYYKDASGNSQAFVVGETTGTWGTAREAPGTAALNHQDGGMGYVSCISAGNCTGSGGYLDGSGFTQPFVIGEAGGTWHKAKEVPGITALNTGGSAGIWSLSCGAAGNCSAGGYYTDSSGHRQAFVVSKTNGTWGTAREVPGSAALNTGGFAVVQSVSCASAGNCSAGGYYTDSSGHQQVFVVGETNGTWGTAREVPGSAALNTGGFAVINEVSCGSAGNCSAGGYYKQITAYEQAFLVSETNGTWGKAVEVPGTAALNTGGLAVTASVSCASTGNCTAGGSYYGSSGLQAFVISETNGNWGTAVDVPGVAALNQRGQAQLEVVSCPSAGNCGAGGYYTDGSNHQQVFVVSQTNGTWGTAVEVPGTAALNVGGNAQIASMSCASPSRCSAGGYYTDNIGAEQAFVVGET